MPFPLTKEQHSAIESMINGQCEIIVAAAIRADDVIIMVERPGRHGDCIGFLHPKGLDVMDQGFVTNRGRFVDRKEAANLALASGQGGPRDNCNGNLFSEDLWGEF